MTTFLNLVGFGVMSPVYFHYTDTMTTVFDTLPQVSKYIIFDLVFMAAFLT